MTTTTHWPSTSITPETFAAGLQAIHAPQAVINQLAPAGGGDSRLPDQLNVLEEFVKAAATPEDRQKFSQAIGCTYDDLTRWAIQADLRRIEGVDAEIAELLASVDVKGVHDLAACTEHPQRLGKLQEDLYQKVNSSTKLDPFKRQALKRRLQRPELVRLGQKGGALPSHVLADVAVILVVKGAGVQRPDETLDVFLNGFWPAVKSVDSRATLSKRQDVFPPGYRSSAYDEKPLNQVTEIRSGERRIWLKEPYWDAALVPANPLGALAKEWRMATYAFGSGIHELFFNPDSRKREISKWQYFLAFLTIYAVIFLHIGLTVAWEYRPWLWSLFGAENVGLLLLTKTVITVAAIIAALAALTVVVLSAFQTQYQMKRYEEKKPLENLPGVGGWVVGLLILTLLFSPNGYVLWVLVWVVLELALLVARAKAWPYREISNSDCVTDHYYSVAEDPKIYKYSKDRLRRVFVLIYRGIVVLTLPITYLLVLIARLMQWTRVLSTVGVGLEKTLNVVLSGGLGDVVSYAMDPAQAHRVRQVIETDLRFFHDRPEVSHIHVFAHSQGTPITFETLFNQLPPPYRKKIKTYATIGSVLSYYHQINPIIDRFYVPRFPVRPYPKDFAVGFKWMNFWNLADPITEFYGLDEYNLVEKEKAPVLKLDDQNNPILLDTQQMLADTKRDPASPVNIRTRATLQNHSEYWSNLDQVQIPFALRVLGLWRPQQWDRDVLKQPMRGLTHTAYVCLWWGISAIAFFALFIPNVTLTAWLVSLAGPVTQELVSMLMSPLKSMFESQVGYANIVLTELTRFAEALALKYSLELLFILLLFAAPALLGLLLAIIHHIASVIRTAAGRNS